MIHNIDAFTLKGIMYAFKPNIYFACKNYNIILFLVTSVQTEIVHGVI